MPKRVAVVLLTALGIGVLGDQLLRPVPWGIGVTLWIAVSVGAALAWTRAAHPNRVPALAAIFGTALFFAVCIAWRDAERLKGWNVLAVLVTLTLGVLQMRELRLRTGRVLDYVAGTAAGAVSTVAGAVILGADALRETNGPQTRTTRVLKGVIVGLVISVPLLLLFGALLVSADPMFERLIRRLFDWDFEQIVSHLMLVGFLSWTAAGYLHVAIISDQRVLELRIPDRRPGLGILEIGIPVGSLTVLFLAFVIIQVRYLFGGEELIRSVVGLTYAEYARRGFFELIAVSGLVLPLLLVAQWALDHREPTAVRIFRWMAVSQLVLVGMIMVSAVQRLQLYYDAYGLTESRFYAAAVLAWIALGLIWFSLTALRGHRERFVFGVVAGGLLVVGSLNLMNPDAVIARANLERGAAGKVLDLDYLNRLSADATPTLMSSLPKLTRNDGCVVAKELAEERENRRDGSWRSWSLGRSRADAATAGIGSVLRSCSDLGPDGSGQR